MVSGFRQRRGTGAQADARRGPGGSGRQYLTALSQGDPHVLETVWPGEVVIYDPRAGEVRGHKRVRRFISDNVSWLGSLHARTETVASTVVGDRAVVELLAPPGPPGGTAGVAGRDRGRIAR